MTAKWKNSYIDLGMGSLTTPFILKKKTVKNTMKSIFINTVAKTITFQFKSKNSILFKDFPNITLSNKFKFNMFYYTGQNFYLIKKFLSKKISINSIKFKRRKKVSKKKQSKK